MKKIKPLLQITSNTMLIYYKGYIGIYDIQANKLLNKLAIPNSRLFKILSKFRVPNRLLRLEPRACEMINENQFLVSHKGRILKCDFTENRIEIEHHFIKGMSSPLMMASINNIEGFDAGIYYGEYTPNLNKNAVSIYRRNIDGVWKNVYTFESGKIHHIHGIIPVIEEQKVFILTGDDDEGSGIWETKDNFKTVIPILTGKQKYRTCLLNYHKGIFTYITDSPMEQNYIYRYVKNNLEWKEIYKKDIPGSCIYGEFRNNEVVFSTTVEPNSYFGEKIGIGFYLQNKIGDGIKDRYVHVYTCNFKDEIKEIEKIKKDVLPMRLFQYGAVTFPKYSFSRFNQIHMFYIAVKGMDNKWKVRKG